MDFEHGLVGDVLGERRLAQALRRTEDQVAPAHDELDLQRALHRRAVDARRRRPVEVGIGVYWPTFAREVAVLLLQRMARAQAREARRDETSEAFSGPLGCSLRRSCPLVANGYSAWFSR